MNTKPDESSNKEMYTVKSMQIILPIELKFLIYIYLSEVATDAVC